MQTAEQQFAVLRESRKNWKNLPTIKLPDGRIMTPPYPPMFYHIKRELARFDHWSEQYPKHSYGEGFLTENLIHLERSSIRLGLIQGSLREALEGT
jgi:hypothetical protein